MMRYIWGIIPGAFFVSMFWFINQGGVNITLRNFGWVAFVYLCLSLIISPLVELTGKQSLRPYRKVFGVLAFFIALVHTGVYFYYEYLYNETFFVLKHFYGSDVASGIIAIIVISLLGITSLNALHRAMGKYWKNIHMLVFPLFCIVALHVAFASRFDAKYMIFIALVIFLRVFAFLKTQETSKERLTNGKYLCVPCGYIYDPAVGDPDSGIAPGTSFESIPDTWRCPVCGVTKSDFIPYTEKTTTLTIQKGKVGEVSFLNPTTIEYSLEFKENIQVIPGQFAKIILSDKDGEFSRSYSVVKSTSNILTFCVKIGSGRGSKIISQLTVGQEIGFGGIFGNFTLENTSNPKVFIATGTGLAPIMNMLSTCPEKIEKYLYFGVRTKQELFYEKEIQTIQNLSSNIFLSQENVENYKTGRIDISNLTFPKETEFYICGNPDMVDFQTKKLNEIGYTRIYSEKFN